MIGRRAGLLLLSFAFPLLSSTTAFTQSPTTGRIAGTVKDQNGAVIVGTEVTISSKTTGEERKVTSDNEGNYSAPLLTPGKYRVRLTAKGFNPANIDSVLVVITET